jgi:hypothetical protein
MELGVTLHMSTAEPEEMQEQVGVRAVAVAVVLLQ